MFIPTRKSEQRFQIAMSEHDYLRMTCVNANCQQEARGWASVLDPENPKHVKAAEFIKMDSGRRYVELRSEGAAEYLSRNGAALGVDMVVLRGIVKRTPPGMLIFVFPPGQQCFRIHKDREVGFAHATYAGTRVHTRAQDYIEDWQETGDRVNRLLGKD